jgi:hypothetical protein
MITVTPPTIPYNYNLSAGVKGEYLPYIVNPDGSEEYPLGKEFMPNVITNIGIDYWFLNTAASTGFYLFVDQTFVRYGAVNESAFVVRNQILEHVTQVGAQRRRDFAAQRTH